MARLAGMRLVPIGLLVVVAFSSCLSSPGATMLAFTEAPLFGKVYDYDQKPCPGARIVVDGAEGPLTDVTGRFVLDPLKRGRHEILVQKEGYEELATSMEFLSKTQVLYLRVISHGQLLRQAEQAIRERKWSDAQGLLDRARSVTPGDPVECYLGAVLLLQQGEADQAARTLEQLASQGFRDPTVYLTLADIYQYRVGDMASARRNLLEYLKMRDDPDVRKRLSALPAAAGGDAPDGAAAAPAGREQAQPPAPSP